MKMLDLDDPDAIIPTKSISDIKTLSADDKVSFPTPSLFITFHFVVSIIGDIKA